LKLTLASTLLKKKQNRKLLSNKMEMNSIWILLRLKILS